MPCRASLIVAPLMESIKSIEVLAVRSTPAAGPKSNPPPKPPGNPRPPPPNKLEKTSSNPPPWPWPPAVNLAPPPMARTASYSLLCSLSDKTENASLISLNLASAFASPGFESGWN